jgi:hypothetical protein
MGLLMTFADPIAMIGRSSMVSLVTLRVELGIGDVLGASGMPIVVEISVAGLIAVQVVGMGELMRGAVGNPKEREACTGQLLTAGRDTAAPLMDVAVDADGLR